MNRHKNVNYRLTLETDLSANSTYQSRIENRVELKTTKSVIAQRSLRYNLLINSICHVISSATICRYLLSQAPYI